MTAENIITIVSEIANDMRVHPQQHKPIQRFFLHRMTSLSIEEIGSMTSACKYKVYNSIQRVERNEKLNVVKAKILQAIS